MGRLVIVETVTHEAGGNHSVAEPPGFVANLESDSEPFARKALKVGTEWVRLDTGWVDAASMVLIHNWDKKRTIEVLLAPTENVALLVRPGTSTRFWPGANALIQLRTVGGEATCAVYVYPR